MNELDSLIEKLRMAYACADRTAPGPFQFVAGVTTASGECICALVLALDSTAARQSAARVLIG